MAEQENTHKTLLCTSSSFVAAIDVLRVRVS